jgi:hypothetical protein
MDKEKRIDIEKNQGKKSRKRTKECPIRLEEQLQRVAIILLPN